jgi:hypothetical protein
MLLRVITRTATREAVTYHPATEKYLLRLLTPLLPQLEQLTSAESYLQEKFPEAFMYLYDRDLLGRLSPVISVLVGIIGYLWVRSPATVLLPWHLGEVLHDWDHLPPLPVIVTGELELPSALDLDRVLGMLAGYHLLGLPSTLKVEGEPLSTSYLETLPPRFNYRQTGDTDGETYYRVMLPDRPILVVSDDFFKGLGQVMVILPTSTYSITVWSYRWSQRYSGWVKQRLQLAREAPS